MKQSLKFLMFMMAVYYFLQAVGGNPGMHDQVLRKFLKEILHFTPTETSAFFAALIIPWTIKPLYGIISDFFPIFGLRRKSYFILAGILGAAAYLTLSWLGFSNQTMLICLFIAAVGFAFSDVLCDAVMVEKGQPLNATDRLQSVQWAASGFAGILISYTKGYIAQYWPLTKALWLVAGISATVAIFTWLALKEEPVSSPKESAKLAWGGLKEAVKNKTLWLTAIFLFLFSCNPHLGNAFYYYEKDFLKFDDVLIGKIDAVGNIGFVVGTLLYGLIAKHFSHKALIHSMIITGVLSNLAYLFFKDSASGYIVSGASSIIFAIAFLGTLTLAAKVCPKYAEGAVFALIMSILNLGEAAGDYSGSYLYEKWTVGKQVIGPQIAYIRLIWVGAGFTAAMWLFTWMVKKEKSNPE